MNNYCRHELLTWIKVEEEPPKGQVPAIVQAFFILNTNTLLASIHPKGSAAPQVPRPGPRVWL